MPPPPQRHQSAQIVQSTVQVGGRFPKAGGRELDGRTWDQVPDRDGHRCPGCGKAGQAVPCVFCGQLQDPACGHGTSYHPADGDGHGRWRCDGCGAISADDPQPAAQAGAR